MAQKPVREECILHGQRLNNLEKQVGDLHKILYQNGFQARIQRIEIDTTLALERIKTNNKLTWAIFSILIGTAAWILWRRK